jgi:hypothetical protein
VREESGTCSLRRERRCEETVANFEVSNELTPAAGSLVLFLPGFFGFFVFLVFYTSLASIFLGLLFYEPWAIDEGRFMSNERMIYYFWG